MNPLAKKIAVFVILVLVVSIGYVAYSGYQEKRDRLAYSQDITVTSSTSTPSQALIPAQEKRNIENIIKIALAKEALKTPENKTIPEYIPKTYPNKYTIANIKLGAPSGDAGLKDYGHKIAIALSPFSQPRTNEMVLMNNILEKIDGKSYDDLKTANKLYANIKVALLNLPVNLETRDLHLNLINALARLEEITADMVKVLDAPEPAFNASSLFQAATIYFYEKILAIDALLESRNIQLDAEDNLNIYLNLAQ